MAAPEVDTSVPRHVCLRLFSPTLHCNNSILSDCAPLFGHEAINIAILTCEILMRISFFPRACIP